MKLLDIILVGFVILLPIYNSCNDVKEVKEVSNEEQVDMFSIAVWELVRRESIQLESYVCPAGYLTIGVGRRTDQKMNISLKEAKDMLYEDIQIRYDMVSKMLPDHSKNERLAVTLLVHNIGLSNLRRQGQWERIVEKSSDVTDYWKKYCYYKKGRKYVKSDNLCKAREVEIAIWNNDVPKLLHLQEELKKAAQKEYDRANN